MCIKICENIYLNSNLDEVDWTVEVDTREYIIVNSTSNTISVLGFLFLFSRKCFKS